MFISTTMVNLFLLLSDPKKFLKEENPSLKSISIICLFGFLASLFLSIVISFLVYQEVSVKLLFPLLAVLVLFIIPFLVSELSIYLVPFILWAAWTSLRHYSIVFKKEEDIPKFKYDWKVFSKIEYTYILSMLLVVSSIILTLLFPLFGLIKNSILIFFFLFIVIRIHLLKKINGFEGIRLLTSLLLYVIIFLLSIYLIFLTVLWVSFPDYMSS